MSLASILRQYCDLPGSQVRLLTSDDVEKFDRGIILVLHVWSGDDIVVLKRLSEVLHAFRDVTLGVSDGDSIDLETLMHLGREEPLHGHGDVFWISDGEVVAKLNRKSNDWEDLVRENTRQLFGLE